MTDRLTRPEARDTPRTALGQEAPKSDGLQKLDEVIAGLERLRDSMGRASFSARKLDVALRTNESLPNDELTPITIGIVIVAIALFVISLCI